MIFSDRGKGFLVCQEGICLSPYLDSVGVKTIAIGATVTEIPNIVSLPWDSKLTLEGAFKLFDRSLKKYVDAVNTVLEVVIEQHQFDALVSLCYNIGTGKVAKREGGIAGSTAIKLINSGESLDDVARAILMWKKPPEIITRRKREVALFVNGNYGNGKALLFPVNSVTHKPVYSKGTSINVFEGI